MKSKHFIPHVNNINLTQLAYNSIKDKSELEGKIFIIDNSEDRELKGQEHLFEKASILWATQPLSTAQTMNWIREIAIDENLDIISWQHNDVEVVGDTFEQCYNIAREKVQNEESFGIIYTQHDTFCIYSIPALKAIGKWDWILFPFYCLDEELEYRMKKRGVEIIYTNLPTIHHNEASSTLKSNKLRMFQSTITFSCNMELLNFKKQYIDENNL